MRLVNEVALDELRTHPLIKVKKRPASDLHFILSVLTSVLSSLLKQLRPRLSSHLLLLPILVQI